MWINIWIYQFVYPFTKTLKFFLVVDNFESYIIKA